MRLAGVLCAVSLISCGPVFAQGAEVHGGINVGVLFTDNVFLVPSPGEVDDMVYQASPFLELIYENQRINAEVRYQFDWFKYSDLDTSTEYHIYDALFTGDLVQEALYLDLGASRSQSPVNPDIVIPPQSLPGFNNVGNRDIYFYSPRFEKTFGPSVSINASYRYEDISYDKSDFDDAQNVQDNSNERARFEIQNYAREQGLTWAARYEWFETEYEVSLPWEYRKASVELGFWTNERIRIFASGGKESAWDDPIDRSLQYDFWEAGFAYRNGDKVDAEFAVGEREFGSSWRGRLTFNIRRGEFSFDYAETPTTTGQYEFSRGNPFDLEVPNDFLDRPGASERYILKGGRARADFEFRRSTLGFVVFHEDRTGRFSDTGTPLPDESQQGVSMTLSWQLGARTELAASGGINNRKFEDSGNQKYITGSLTASYHLGSSLGMSLGYNYTEQDPETGSGGRDYVSNIVSLFLNYSF
jgi:hypothetical protein